MTINSNTKKAQGMIQSYDHAIRSGGPVDLYQAYGKYSKAKADAMEYCKLLQHIRGGKCGVITGHNCFTFTYAFLLVEHSTPYLMYITRDNDYKIPLIDNKTGELYLHEYLSAAGLF